LEILTIFERQYMNQEKEQFERRKKVLYDMICDRQYVPMKIKEIAILLQVPKESRDELRSLLDALVLEGKVELSAKGKYRKASAKFAEGIYEANPRGFGFVRVENREEDIFIPEDKAGNAMHLDRVQVAILQAKEDRRAEGSIVKILERGTKELVGTYQKSRTYGFVVPDNPRILSDIFIAQENSLGAMDGHKVKVVLTSYGDNGKNPEGKVTEIIGHINDPGTDILSVVYGLGLPTDFPDKVLRQAERTPLSVSEADMAGRLDLRAVPMVTIDGEDAKDLDDAVSLSMKDGHYHLGVHIADVSNYVQENSALDREALERGTSVYLADRVIPMLPHRLSNGICSLNAGCDRLALSCLMEFDDKGKLLSHQVAETVICVDRRMSYNQVRAILEDGDEALCGEFAAQVPMLQQMAELSKILRAARKKRGAIDFDFPEAKVKLDEQGVPVEITPYLRNCATELIEDFMLAANETIAEEFFWAQIPFVYRTHEAPDTDRIRELAVMIYSGADRKKAAAYALRGVSDEVKPREVQKLLDQVAGHPEERMISRLMLRSMKQASYTTECLGHFGLAANYYCHFTSPIRRYPDLQIHRIIKDVLRGRMNEERSFHYTELLPQVAEQSSVTERRAEEAERETIKLKKAEYMERHIGETFDAVVSGIASYGLYVELENTVEGLMHDQDVR
jgi:ribonuclease R